MSLQFRDLSAFFLIPASSLSVCILLGHCPPYLMGSFVRFDRRVRIDLVSHSLSFRICRPLSHFSISCPSLSVSLRVYFRRNKQPVCLWPPLSSLIPCTCFGRIRVIRTSCLPGLTCGSVSSWSGCDFGCSWQHFSNARLLHLC